MKIKGHLVATEPVSFLKGSCIDLFISDRASGVEGWLNLGEVEFEMEDLDYDTLLPMVLDIIDEQTKTEVAKHTVKMDRLKRNKQELLAITYDGEQDG